MTHQENCTMKNFIIENKKAKELKLFYVISMGKVI